MSWATIVILEVYIAGAGAFAIFAWPAVAEETDCRAIRVAVTAFAAIIWPILVPFIISCAIVEAARTRQG